MKTILKLFLLLSTIHCPLSTVFACPYSVGVYGKVYGRPSFETIRRVGPVIFIDNDTEEVFSFPVDRSDYSALVPGGRVYRIGLLTHRKYYFDTRVVDLPCEENLSINVNLPGTLKIFAKD